MYRSCAHRFFTLSRSIGRECLCGRLWPSPSQQNQIGEASAGYWWRARCAAQRSALVGSGLGRPITWGACPGLRRLCVAKSKRASLVFLFLILTVDLGFGGLGLVHRISVD